MALPLDECEVPAYAIPSLPALHVPWIKYSAYERESHQCKHKVVVPPIVWCGIERPCWLVTLSMENVPILKQGNTTRSKPHDKWHPSTASTPKRSKVYLFAYGILVGMLLGWGFFH